MTKVLFICKLRMFNNGSATEDKISQAAGAGYSSGLFNSARFVTEMLGQITETKLVQAFDNNSIDRYCAEYKPTHAIIEALWVVPSKFEVLCRLHPDIKWIIRLHSEMPFLAGEGMAMEWFFDYLAYPNITISCNSPRANSEMQLLANQAYPSLSAEERIVYLPNYYPVQDHAPPRHRDQNSDWINIGCFGAIRPLKNQLMQAAAAIRFCNDRGKRLAFHINTGRVEGKGEPILRNIRGLFAHLPNHRLVEHGWLTHEEFLKVVRQMDLGMQVSFTETFNIVAADFVDNDVPIVVSPEITWASDGVKADPTNLEDIVKKMGYAWLVGNTFSLINHGNRNKQRLRGYSRDSAGIWHDYFSGDSA